MAEYASVYLRWLPYKLIIYGNHIHAWNTSSDVSPLYNADLEHRFIRAVLREFYTNFSTDIHAFFKWEVFIFLNI